MLHNKPGPILRHKSRSSPLPHLVQLCQRASIHLGCRLSRRITLKPDRDRLLFKLPTSTLRLQDQRHRSPLGHPRVRKAFSLLPTISCHRTASRRQLALRQLMTAIQGQLYARSRTLLTKPDIEEHLNVCQNVERISVAEVAEIVLQVLCLICPHHLCH